MNEHEIKVLDLGEAAALQASGFKVLRLDKTKKPRQRAFVFSHETKIPGLLESYRAHDLQIDAYELYLAIKDLKSRLHDAIDAEELN